MSSHNNNNNWKTWINVWKSKQLVIWRRLVINQSTKEEIPKKTIKTLILKLVNKSTIPVWIAKTNKGICRNKILLLLN